jgi:hypothetical protein
VLDTFEAQPLGDDDANGSDLDEGEAVSFSIKYLTSSKLMSLEVFSQCYQICHPCVGAVDLDLPGSVMEADPLEKETNPEPMK